MSNAALVIDEDQRRARLAVRHRLTVAGRASTVEEVADSLVAVHATDPATVFLSIGARLTAPSTELIDEALYDHGTLRRMHGMRRTVFVFPADLAQAVHAGATLPIAVRERKLLLQFIQASGFDACWLADVEKNALEALRQLGEATAAELSAHEPRLKEQVAVAPDRPNAVRFGIGSRLLTALAMEGRIVRRRPRGTWNSNQFRWAVAVAVAAAVAAAAAVEALTPEGARVELARRWLAAFGPATEADLKWWTGWGLTQARQALATLGCVPVALAEGTGWVLPDDVEPVAPVEPWAALLPALDSTAMGWQQRSWYLPQEHVRTLFDRTGNIGPTVWWNGRVVGGWAHRPGGEVVWRLLDSPGAEAAAAIEVEAARLSGWLGGATVTPRFRTPLERELSA